MTLPAFASSDALLHFAQSAGGGAGAPGGLLGNPMVFMVLMFVMMYFVLIRPQRQRQKQHEELLKALKAGDHVVTSGGEHGIISSIKETTVMLRVADNVRIEYDRAAIASVKKAADKPEEAAPAKS
ncbi:MAG: preprotein translocase subunit YajC [Verrucomicrobiaceae bacterium]|nr:preprotein translocase subunit YajC [Verrucomicrobiaceae bacterium]